MGRYGTGQYIGLASGDFTTTCTVVTTDCMLPLFCNKYE